MATRFLGLARITGRRRVVSTTQRFFSYPPHEVVGLPSLSPTMETGSISAWIMQEGTEFAAGDIFCSVETDKATVDFEAQDDGVLAKILADAGPAELKVGSPIMVTVEDTSDVAAFKDFVAEANADEPASPPAEAPSASLPPPPGQEAAPSVVAQAASSGSSGDRVVASPLAHMLAKEMGYDIASIHGTGPDGRIIAADVKEFTPSSAKDSQSTGSMVGPPVAGDGFTDYPLSDEARQLAAQFVHSKQNVPHYYLTIEIVCDELLAMREKLNGSSSLASDTASLGAYELFIKAAAVAMRTVPIVNAAWTDTSVRVYDRIDTNVVLGAGDELTVPVIRDTGGKGLLAISEELAAAMSNEESEKPVDHSVGTFTMINLGMYGIKSCAPIVREPQAASLALGSIEPRIVPDDDSADGYKEILMLTATMSFDHRVVDGAVGAQWLSAFKSHVEDPTTLLL